MNVSMDTLNPAAFDQLITVNNRLAQALHLRHDRAQAASGKQVWATPDITPWHVWLQQGYEQLIDSGFTRRILLNPHQERLLWERVVRHSREGENLLRPAAAARTAQQAWQLVQDWQLSNAQLQQQAAEETRAYLAWQTHFADICARQSLISRAELPALLHAAAQADALEVQKRIQLAGFDAINPMQQALLDALAEQGCSITLLKPAKNTNERSRIELDSPDTEMLAAASWAKQHIEKNPQAQVAIVCPKLQDQRDTLERICNTVISPHNLLPHPAQQPGFNISLGRPLAQYPLVAHVLLGLKLGLSKPLTIHDVGTLLRSPFIGRHTEEWEQRAQLDATLRENGQPRLDRHRLLHQARTFDRGRPAHAPLLIEQLEQFDQLIKTLPKAASPNRWAGYLLQLIECLGWPGQQTLDSHEFQQATKLRETISTFATLTRVHQSMRYAEVLHRLDQLCEESVFQPQSDGAAIQVLGALEAAGMQFDAIWLLGLDDNTWPPSPSPNPLLPTSLQRELGMPHASADRELQFARHLTDQLLHCAPQVIASHASKDGDREQRPSPLSRDLPLRNLNDLGIELDTRLYSAAQQSAAGDLLAAPEATPPSRPPEGGSWLLSAQSACPFSAVGKYRLKAKPLPEPSAAPSPMLLGQMVHELLKRVWQTLQTAEILRATEDDALRALIAPHARDTLAKLGKQRPDIFTDTFVELEVQRLQELVLAWLNLEKRRGLPFQVKYLEQAQPFDLNGLPLRLQADRVDQLDDGRLVIIDYKTGEHADAKGWQDPRPRDLQIPLYCTQAEQAPAAALIARVHTRSIQFRGLAVDENIAPGIKPFEGDEDIADWAALLEHWRQSLHALAEEIQQGHADIQPQDEQACQFCDLGPLCRISSLTEQEPADD